MDVAIVGAGGGHGRRRAPSRRGHTVTAVSAGTRLGFRAASPCPACPSSTRARRHRSDGRGRRGARRRAGERDRGDRLLGVAADVLAQLLACVGARCPGAGEGRGGGDSRSPSRRSPTCAGDRDQLPGCAPPSPRRRGRGTRWRGRRTRIWAARPSAWMTTPPALPRGCGPRLERPGGAVRSRAPGVSRSRAPPTPVAASSRCSEATVDNVGARRRRRLHRTVSCAVTPATVEQEPRRALRAPPGGVNAYVVLARVALDSRRPPGGSTRRARPRSRGALAVGADADRHDLRAATDAWRAAGGRVGLVPTMAPCMPACLVDRAGRAPPRPGRLIFVNPRQFGRTEDFGPVPTR